MVAQAVELYAPVDILVNNAGIPTREPGEEAKSGWEDFHTSDPASWRKVVDLNIYGTMNCTHAVLPGMVAREGGKIISIMSEAGRVGEAKLAAYSGAKAGILGLTRSLAKELGPKIMINAICPGVIETELGNSLTRSRGEEMKKGIMLNRLGTPADVAQLVAFLATSEPCFITGQHFVIDGFQWSC